MFKKLAFIAALAGALLISPVAFAQRNGHSEGSRGFSGGRNFSGHDSRGDRDFRGGYGVRRFDRDYYRGPRIGVGLGFYGSGYAPPCGGFYDRWGHWHSSAGCYAYPY